MTSCTLKTDPETRQSRGFGFVVFKNGETVQKVKFLSEIFVVVYFSNSYLSASCCLPVEMIRHYF